MRTTADKKRELVEELITHAGRTEIEVKIMLDHIQLDAKLIEREHRFRSHAKPYWQSGYRRAG